VREMYMEKSDSKLTKWEESSVNRELNLIIIDENEKRLTKFDQEIASYVVVNIDEKTGRASAQCDWFKIVGAIKNEVILCTVTRTRPSVFHPIKNIKAGIEAGKKTKIWEEFYREYIQSGLYQAELIKACEKYEDDPDKMNNQIVAYLKLLSKNLKKKMEDVEKKR